MKGITIYDYLLLPLYLYAVFLVFKKLRLKYKDKQHLYLYFTWGFRIKIVCIIIYTLLINYSMRGDSVNIYFAEGEHFAQIIKDDPSQIDLLFTTGGKYIDKLADDETKGYLLMESNYMVVKFVIALSFFTFSKYMLICLIMGFIAFLGSWRLFMFFHDLYPQLHKQFAICALAIPNVIFWTSGISKDTICMASIGFLVKALFDITVRKTKLIPNTIITILAFYFILTIKSYIIYSFLPFYLPFLFFYTVKTTDKMIYRWALRILIPLSLFLIFFIFSDSLEKQISDFSTEKVMENVTYTQSSFERQAATTEGSFFSIGDFDGTTSSFLRLAPKAVLTTLFRPFFWEAHNVVMLASALENLALTIFIILILFKGGGIVNFFKKIFSEAAVSFSICYTIVFFAFVGVTTANFGSLVRYKIPAIPFLISALVIIYYKKDPPKKDTIINF